MVRAGFIGLGSQGNGMARRLLDLGFPLTLWARSAHTLEPFIGTSADVATTPAALGAACDVVGICVTDGAAVRAVTLEPDGVLAGMQPGSVLAIHSTIATDDCAEIAAAAEARGVAVLDAPVSGGGEAAAAGRLTVYVGGNAAALDRARPIFEAYGENVVHMGGPGAGLRTKFLNNALNAAHFALAHDVFETGVGLGLDPDALALALRQGSGRSFSLEVFVALRSFDGIAAHLGPIMAKDITLFAAETSGTEADGVVLDAADRFLELLHHPRTESAS